MPKKKAHLACDPRTTVVSFGAVPAPSTVCCIIKWGGKEIGNGRRIEVAAMTIRS
jgi:hypothetical protein